MPPPQPLVLIADDDRDTRELYRACLDTTGFRTAEAGTGSQTIASAIEMVPDVLLTDLVMPDFDGVAVAQRLRADPRTAGIHVLLVTGHATPELESRAQTAGIERVLLKPCLPQAVMREVSRALARPPFRALERRVMSTRAATANRIRSEFASLPGLSLTSEQARLLFDVDRGTCERILDALVVEGFLSRTAQGGFRRERS